MKLVQQNHFYTEISKEIEISDFGHTACFSWLVEASLCIAIEKKRCLCVSTSVGLIFTTSFFYTVFCFYSPECSKIVLSHPRILEWGIFSVPRVHPPPWVPGTLDL